MTVANRAWAAQEPTSREPATVSYSAFIERKSQDVSMHGFAPLWMPDNLFDFQVALTEWALLKGRGGVFADCGLGKTAIQLVWAENVVRQTNKPVLILTPLAVGAQTVIEAEKFGVSAVRSRDGVVPPGARVVVANYEKLHLFDSSQFSGMVCDESSILKHVSGATQKAVTRFMLKLPYRLLCTATAAPNDYIELGTSSEALGELSHSEMLTRFFSQSEAKPCRIEDVKNARKAQHFAKLAFRVTQTIEQWHLKPHAEDHFWKWVCSWARACRQPSDLGFADGRFQLPQLIEREHTVVARTLAPGQLFARAAVGLQEEREERRRTLTERCETVAALTDHHRAAVVWCHLNAEGDLLEEMLIDAKQVKGAQSDEQKEELFTAFASGQLQKLITKPKIGAWGLNWQHCSDVVTFASHSYEQYYQSVRRCWRFGQERPVTVDLVSTEGEVGVRLNMLRKAEAAKKMFANLVTHMNDSTHIRRIPGNQSIQVPAWLSANK